MPIIPHDGSVLIEIPIPYGNKYNDRSQPSAMYNYKQSFMC